MLDKSQAVAIIRKNLPQGHIGRVISYEGEYVFQVYLPDLEEIGADPFYAVHQETGVFREFSILTDGDISEITRLYLEQPEEVDN